MAASIEKLQIKLNVALLFLAFHFFFAKNARQLQ